MGGGGFVLRWHHLSPCAVSLSVLLSHHGGLDLSGGLRANRRCHRRSDDFILTCRAEPEGGRSGVWNELLQTRLVCPRSASSPGGRPSLVSLQTCRLRFGVKNESHLSVTAVAWSAVTGVVPSAKLKRDHGNIHLSLCSCQHRSYRCDGYLCQKGRFKTSHTANRLPWIYMGHSLSGLTVWIISEDMMARWCFDSWLITSCCLHLECLIKGNVK